MRYAQVIVVACLGLAWACAGFAQSAPAADDGSEREVTVAEANGPGQPAERPARSVPEAGVNERLELRGDDGKTVEVPVDAPTRREFLEWLRSRDRPAAKPAPEYGIARVSLEGRADDERATLTATVQVKVNAADQWIRVPLRLNEAVLRETRHSGPGEAVFDAFERETGYRWWLRGAGLHELTLELVVPVRRQVPSRRLQLALPAAAATELRLRVPLPLERLSVQAPERSAWESRAVGEGESEIEVQGLGEQFVLNWHPLPVPSEVRTVLQADTRWSVALTDESVLLKPVVQRIQALEGSFSEVRVRLPADFELLDLSVAGRPYSNPEPDADDPRRVTVRLSEPTTGPVELRWTMELPFRGGDELRLEGFQVEDALRQTGEIMIDVPEGYHIRQREGREIRRTSAAPFVNAGRAAGAYHYFRQPFLLVLGVQEVEPYFTVDPHLALRLGEKRAELVADFRFEVFRGAIGEVELEWPLFDGEGWKIEPMEEPRLIERAEIDRETGTIRVRLVQRKGSQSESSFRVPLRATRDIVKEEPFALTLPTARASGRPRTFLVLAEDENVKASLLPEEATSLVPLPNRLPREEADVPQEFRDLRRAEFHVDSLAHEFTAQVLVQSSTIGTETSVLVDLRDDGVHVTQRISYDVSYRRLSQARLLVPRVLLDQRRIEFLEDDRPVMYQPNGIDDGSLVPVRVSLFEPRSRFDMVMRYALPWPQELQPGAETALRIPLVQSGDAEFSSTRCTFQGDGRYEAVVADSRWTRQSGLETAVEWVAAEARSEIPLSLRYARTHGPQDYAVRRALVRTEFGTDGTSRSRAQYRIQGAVSSVLLQFPDRLVPGAFWWNGERLSSAEVVEIAPGELRLHVPNSDERSENLLTVDFHSEAAAPFGWSQTHRAYAPQFPPGVWVAETAWEVTLPYDQHLLLPPRGFTSRFQWQRQTLFWGREPVPEYSDLDAWISTSDGPPRRGGGPEGNAYVLSRYGPERSIAFRSMSRWTLLALGAGVAWALGLILLKLPATRNVVTLLTMSLLGAVAAVWYAAPVQLFLQPAALGLLLAVAAVMIDGMVHRRTAPTILTLSSPSDFVAPSASTLDRVRMASVGSEDPTDVRPALVSDPVSSVHSRHGT